MLIKAADASKRGIKTRSDIAQDKVKGGWTHNASNRVKISEYRRVIKGKVVKLSKKKCRFCSYKTNVVMSMNNGVIPKRSAG